MYQVVDKYKYLGIYFDEFLDFKCTASMFAREGGRALGSIISKFKSLKNVGFETYTKLYHTGVVPVMDYSLGIWGFKNYSECEKIQQRTLRYYMGVHPKTLLLALVGDTGCLNPSVRRHVEMLRFWNWVLKMDENRITHRIFDYDYKLYKANWCYDMKQLFSNVNNNKIYDM